MINDLRKQLESIGATLDEQAEQFVVCDSPSGYVWRANGASRSTSVARADESVRQPLTE